MLKGKGRSLVLMLVLLAVLALVGCGSPETKVSADEVVQDALAAQAGVSSSSVAITIDATANGMMGQTALDVAIDGSVNGDFDWANKKMKAHLGMNVNVTDPMVINTQVTGDVYALDNVSYMKLAFMGDESWSKSALPMDFWFTQENSEFINGLLQSTDAESLPDDKVGGVNCYVLGLTPDVAALQTILEQQAGTGEEVPDIASLIDNLSVKVWVAKDTSYVTKIELTLKANIPSEVLGGAAGGEGLAVDLTVTMQFSKFNESVAIQLPAEAQDAEEGLELPFDFSSFF